ncbi:bifunctional D-glycero-beta-D-manno-heptose-7-phosphate kinase/D-glycero-beta-D-manno-heptose 1-phosphate adenylyltransferase HldE [Pseudomaricurvus alkylphenolicus]|uniref:bifunctional D-glycero-beta-D-manno-heptose-7-phosphate kinase/D-glycero-beta-D-manno-heptose 1-phosphate adenylyltransferase HldE n=1 Tax=Pseudomaricurvus alkylphenolicus TaxID=1306991 RepID=UPI0014243306|nr:bifunctional D-glycero-beta-D-manno-heptose-7-phosphate kinase/D-glycero-beta-D-manno-heptose 1-phosphate adenylyltransferase HldE [Pseudomaricurvus alkylphenolicus]NIB42858.1 bifunctional D-glycero-beta-D-manno-heptose-7-phosphate kinase/D-glycero-beta-D-manno-heptose 1-phosphate adenylyltransferase HldE [Pseudomaricurvus alkylphenolicus]
MQLSMPQFDRSQVLVIGDVMLDRYWSGGTSRISPEAPVPVVKVNGVEDRPGGAANVALNIAALGSGASVVSVVGADEAAETLRTSLQSVGIHTDFQVSADKPTITKLRVISRHQQLIRMDFEESFGLEDSADFLSKAKKLLPHMGAVILSDYAKGSLQDTLGLIDAARDAKVPVLVDPKGTDFARYRGATLLTPNLHEFEAVVGSCSSELELVNRGTALMRKLDLEALLVTRGEHGMTLLRPDMPELHLPARAREVFDVTGAGDTVISVLASSLAAGTELPQAVALANLAAGIVVGKLGTATISGPELRRAIQTEQGSERGVMSEEQLLIALADARAHGEKIVFTNGCFDIIHAGHVGYLEDARALGDRLVVAINSDDSVRRLKGPTRPINPVDRRMAVLAGLEAVDWVLDFEDDTPQRLLQSIKPDVLVKGGDYTADQVVGWEIVKAYGGEVKVLSFFDNCSTTAIVEKILDQDDS